MSEERFATCNLCESLCGLRIVVDGDRVTSLKGDEDDVLSRGHVCPKAIGLKALLEDPDRLRAPVIRTTTGWETVSWERALEAAVEPLRAIRAKHGPDAVALYVGNPVVHAHRSAFAAELLTLALGSKNRFDPNSQDSNPRLFACMEVYGDALSNPIPDVERTEFLLMLGANPAASQGSQMGLGDARSRLKALRDRGARIVLVDPRRTETAAWATEHHFIRPGGDAALLLAMFHVLFGEGLVAAKISEVASGVEALRALSTPFTPERVGPSVGIEAATIRRLARDFAASARAVAYARVGVCQNAFGPVASWLVEALNTVTGNLGREGGALFPTPAADVGAIGRLFIGNHWGRWRSRVRGLPEFLGVLPSGALIEEMETPGDGQIRALVCLAGNPVLSTPNGERLGGAIEKLEHVVALDFYVNETTRHAKVILPPRHVFETGSFDLFLARFAVRNTARYSEPILKTGDDTRDDWEIATELALRLRVPGPLRRAGRRLARKLPERVVDALLRFGPHKMRLATLRESPHGVDLGPLRAGTAGWIHTPDGKVRLAPKSLSDDVPRVAAWVDGARDAIVLIGRRDLRSNNSWMHNLRPLAKGPDRARLLMHPLDATARGLVDGGRVRIGSRVGAVVATLTVTDDVMPGVVSLPHGFGHAAAAATLKIAGALPGPNVNALTDDRLLEPVIGTSILNGVPVTVESADAS